MPEFSDAIQDLIQKSRIVSFERWQGTHPPAAIARFQAADDERRYLTDADLAEIQALAPKHTALVPVMIVLRDRVTEIVDEARTQLLEQYPELIQPGGKLYPQERAEACWRDFWHFLRCISYGIAGQHRDYLSQVGLHHMEQLYQVLQVPLNAMVVGLEGIKTASLKRVDSAQHAILAPYFDHLILHLQHFDDD
jgi:Phycobilisome protein